MGIGDGGRGSGLGSGWNRSEHINMFNTKRGSKRRPNSARQNFSSSSQAGYTFYDYLLKIRLSPLRDTTAAPMSAGVVPAGQEEVGGAPALATKFGQSFGTRSAPPPHGREELRPPHKPAALQEKRFSVSLRIFRSGNHAGVFGAEITQCFFPPHEMVVFAWYYFLPTDFVFVWYYFPPHEMVVHFLTPHPHFRIFLVLRGVRIWHNANG